MCQLEFPREERKTKELAARMEAAAQIHVLSSSKGMNKAAAVPSWHGHGWQLGKGKDYLPFGVADLHVSFRKKKNLPVPVLQGSLILCSCSCSASYLIFIYRLSILTGGRKWFLSPTLCGYLPSHQLITV